MEMKSEGLLGVGDVGQGYISFNTSSPSREAQHLFTTGLALHYGFWYDLSAVYLEAALETDSNFAMAACMQSMAYFHGLWGYEYPEQALPALNRISSMNTSQVTDREWMYINATRILWLSDGSTMERVALWRDAMGRIVEAYPDDVDAVTFMALAELTLVYPGERGFLKRGDVPGTIASLHRALNLNRYHTGALHMLVHASDSPGSTAKAARYGAERLGATAPDSFHLHHMPTHLFLRVGDWEACALGNTNAQGAKMRFLERNGADAKDRSQWDWHSLEFLHYCFLQQERYGDAEELGALMAPLGPVDDHSWRIRRRLVSSRYVVETRGWNTSWDFDTDIPCLICSMGECKDCVGDLFDGQFEWVYMANAAGRLAGGISAVELGELDTAEACARDLERYVAETSAVEPLSMTMAMYALEMRGYIECVGHDRYEDGLAYLAAAHEFELQWDPPAYGPPAPIVPVSEMYGWLLLRNPNVTPRDVAFAQDLFRYSLNQNPKRRHSVQGFALATVDS
mmetsp:Transcript_19448/g.54646  ORF Transcript_19448/g.54646 Transcript_19448/m.54646 type:complete len:513 (+) Transcript_19448:1-1539(+)